MSAGDKSSEVADVAVRIGERVASDGDRVVELGEKAVVLQLQWISYAKSSLLTGVANELLDGVHAAAIETVYLASIGIARSALYSMRLQYELGIAWLYYRDHAVEWKNAMKSSQGLLLPAACEKYLKVNVAGYETRVQLVHGVRRRAVERPYELLSQHVHGCSEMSIPQMGRAISLVESVRRCEEAMEILGSVGEAMADMYASRFAEQWMDWPNEIRAGIVGRLVPSELKKFCSR